jgi:hypothetical protein
MTATITQFRKDLFHLADLALKGEAVEFTYRGVVFKVTPEKKQPKIERLTGQAVLAQNADLALAEKELLAEMEAAWTKDWSEL